MQNWYVLSHNPTKYQSLERHLSALDVEIYCPMYTELKPRQDRPSLRKKSKRLFDGYVFLRFDPEVVHTTTITALSGASEFIRFGSSTPYVVDSRLIAALKQASLLRVDRHLRIIECRNMSDELVQELQFIVDMRNRSLRQQAFFNLLEQQMYLSRLGRSGAKQALIYTALA